MTFWATENPNWEIEAYIQFSQKVIVWTGFLRNTIAGPTDDQKYFLSSVIGPYLNFFWRYSDECKQFVNYWAFFEVTINMTGDKRISSCILNQLTVQLFENVSQQKYYFFKVNVLCSITLVNFISCDLIRSLTLISWVFFHLF